MITRRIIWLKSISQGGEQFSQRLRKKELECQMKIQNNSFQV